MANDSPKVSIIIATWQAAETLERCLNSIIEQDFTDWELVIADGGSTDDTVDILRRHDTRISWWVSQKDYGIYDAWNTALANARGEYVCFLGADDAWATRQALSRLFEEVGNAEYDLVTSTGLFTNPETGKSFEFGSAFDYRRIGPRMVVCHPGLLHRRELFNKYGLFDTRYRIAADLEFLLRLPADTRSLHVETTSVIINDGGISRTSVMRRLREQREVLRRCPRFGPIRAYAVWLDKLWRFPIAQIFGISH